MSPLRWTCKSLRQVAAELAALGDRVSHTVVGELLRQQKFSLQANRKTREGDSHPDRDAQFAYINTEVSAALAEGQRHLGRHQEKGTRRRLQECRTRVASPRRAGRGAGPRLPDQGTGPGGPLWHLRSRQQCRLGDVGITHDTAAFAVQTIRRWWQEIGRARYPEATRLVITADGGGSNGYRVRLWKRELQRLADETGIALRCITCPRGPASGTRSSTVYSRSYRKTGGPNRWSAIRSSSI